MDGPTQSRIRRRDVRPDSFSNSRDFVPASSFETHGEWFGNPGLDASFVFAKGLSWLVGTRDDDNSAGS